MTRSRFRVIPSPVGDILIVATDDGIVTLHTLDEPLGGEIARLSQALGAVPEHDDDIAADLVGQVGEYFDGERRTFDVKLDWQLVRRFTRTALEAVIDVPYAETAGYGEIAIAAGSPRAARAVGTACATSPFSLVVPVHRVVRADGSLGAYGRRPDVKRFLLDLERAAGE